MPGKEAVGQVAAQVDVLEERVVGAQVADRVAVDGLVLRQDVVVHVLEVGRVRVLRVRKDGVYGVAQLLLVVQLSDEADECVVRRETTGDGSLRVLLLVFTESCKAEVDEQTYISKRSSIAPSHNVCVRGTRVIVTRDDLVKADHAMLIGDLDTAQERAVKTTESVVSSWGFGARVATRGISAPDVDEQRGHGLAGIHIDELELQVHRNANLVLGDVAADELALDVVGPNGLGATQDGRRVGTKDILIRRGAERRGHVVVQRVVVGDLLLVAAEQVLVQGQGSRLSQVRQGRRTALDGLLLYRRTLVGAAGHLCSSILCGSLVKHALAFQMRDVCMMIAWVANDLMAKQGRKDQEISKEVENGFGHCDRAELIAVSSKMVDWEAG